MGGDEELREKSQRRQQRAGGGVRWRGRREGPLERGARARRRRVGMRKGRRGPTLLPPAPSRGRARAEAVRLVIALGARVPNRLLNMRLGKWMEDSR